VTSFQTRVRSAKIVAARNEEVQSAGGIPQASENANPASVRLSVSARGPEIPGRRRIPTRPAPSLGETGMRTSTQAGWYSVSRRFQFVGPTVVRLGRRRRHSVLGDGAMSNEDRAAIEKAVENWMAAWERKDPHLAVQDYAEDADWTNVFGVRCRSRAELETTLTKIFSSPFAMAGRDTVGGQELRFLRPDVALVRTRVERHGQLMPSGEPMGTRYYSSAGVRTDRGRLENREPSNLGCEGSRTTAALSEPIPQPPGTWGISPRGRTPPRAWS
jgi:uncharacterized protein (TIGR02246 family)